MRKQIICIFLAVMYVTNSLVAAFAAEDKSVYSDAQIENIVARYANQENALQSLFCNDANIGYWSLVNNIEQNEFLSWAVDTSSKLIGEYPDQQDYAEILAALVTMQSGELVEQIAAQGRFDDIKGTTDYVLEAVDIASSCLGADEALEILTKVLDTSVSGISDVIIENNEQAKYYEMVFQDYSQSRSFLYAISRNAENEELRNVATSLLNANDSLLSQRLSYLTDAAENIADYEAEFFVENLWWDLLKESDLYASDSTVKFFVDEGLAFVNKIKSICDPIELAFRATILAGDIGFGTSNTFNRYQEMKVIADIAGALVKANDNVAMPNEVNQAKLDAIQQKCYYYKTLLVAHARGEYLMHQLLMNDAEVASDIHWILDYVNAPEESTDTWYENQVKVLTKYYSVLDNIFDLESNNMWLLTSEKVYSMDSVRETSYTYSPDGKLLLKQEDFFGSWDLEIYEYNERGFASSITYESIPSTVQDYREVIYREDGSILCTIYRNSQGIEQSRSSDSDYSSYVGETFSVNLPGWSDSDSEHREYEYDAQGNVLEERSYNSDGTLSSKIVQEFDSHNNVVYRYVDGDVAFGGEFVYTYTYSDNGDIVSTQCFKDGELYTDSKRVYSDDGYTEETYCYMIKYDHSVATYTSDGRLLESTSIDQVVSYEYELDDAGNVIRKKKFIDIGDGKELESTMEYTYAKP